MKSNSVVLALAMCSAAFGQNAVLMNGSALLHGVGFSYETRLEPSTPPFAGGFVGGAVTNKQGIHRYLAYNSLHKFFGYDLQIEREEAAGTYRVVFRPLSIDPARIELENPESWTIIPLPTIPSPQTIHDGDSIAVEMFTNAATGQKIVDYLHFPKVIDSARPYVIAAGDMIYVNVLHTPDVSGNVEVRADGLVSVRFAGEIQAAGLTTQQLSQAITERLTKFYNHPEVNVQVVRVKSKYYISGEVRRPGTYDLTHPKTVYDAIIEAGGPADFAKKKAIYILRGKEKILFNFVDVSKGSHLEQNINLQNGDTIMVP